MVTDGVIVSEGTNRAHGSDWQRCRALRRIEQSVSRRMDFEDGGGQRCSTGEKKQFWCASIGNVVQSRAPLALSRMTKDRVLPRVKNEINVGWRGATAAEWLVVDGCALLREWR